MLKEHLNWKNSTFPLNPTDKIKEILSSGFIYVHGRDNRYRPNVWLNPDVYIKLLKNYSTSDWINSLNYLFGYLVTHSLIPGQVENWNLIADISKTSVLQIPADLKIIFSNLGTNFKYRLNVLYIIKVPFLLRMLWNVISAMLEPGTKKKTKVYGEDYLGEISSITNITQIEKKYKGSAENVERKYFPPIFPSDQYLTEKDNREELLLPEEKYIEKLRSHNKIRPSPYILRENENITFQTSNSNVLVKKIISNEGIINTVYEEAKSQGSIKINNQKYEEFFEKNQNALKKRLNLT